MIRDHGMTQTGKRTHGTMTHMGRRPAKQKASQRWARLMSVAFVACIIALCVLAWLPGNEMRRTPLGGHAEHALAYFGTTIVMGLALQRRIRLDIQCALLTLYAAFLEMGQLFSPDRHASVRDFAFSTTGIAIGGLLLWIMRSRTKVTAEDWSD